MFDRPLLSKHVDTGSPDRVQSLCNLLLDPRSIGALLITQGPILF